MNGNVCSRALAVAGLVLAGGLTAYELTWWQQTGTARVLAGFGVAIVLLAVAVLVGQAGRRGGGEG